VTAALSLVARLRALPTEDRRAILERLPARQLAALKWAWRDFWARPDAREPAAPHLGTGQLAPAGTWTWWGNIGGRGSGKTRTCAEWVTEKACDLGKGFVVHLVAQTPEDGRDAMIEGVSGLATIAPPWSGFDFKSSKEGGTITWRSGARGRVFGANVPRKGRGPACCAMWLDDPAAFGPQGLATFKMLLYGFRERMPDGSDPQGVVSSTPIDSDLLDEILSGEDGSQGTTVVYSWSASDDNRANLSEKWFTETLAKIAATDPELELQERYGKRIKKADGKAFAGVNLVAPPVKVDALPGDIVSIGLWVDPATSSAVHSCEVGVVVLALARAGHVYALEDLSRVMNSAEWPVVVVRAADRFRASFPWAHVYLGIETNKGGNMGPALLELAEKNQRLEEGGSGIATYEVRTVFASVGKGQRAAPVRAAAAAGRFHLLAGLGALTRQLQELDDAEGPKRDRADACVHGAVDLLRSATAVTDPMPEGRIGPAPLGAVAVGPSVQNPAAFQFGTPGRWR